MSLFDDFEIKKDCYQVLVVPNITYQKDIDKASFVKFFSDLVRELNKTRDDLIWHVPLTAYSRLLNIPNVVQYTNLRLPTYPNSMRGYFDHRAWLKIVDWKYKDFDFVFSQLPEWTVNISNFLSNATHFGVLPIIGYCHWTETKEFAKYARTYLSYNLQGTLEMLECGLNTQTQIRNIINNEASQWFNSKTIKKLSSIMKPHYIGVNDEDIAKDICKEPNKTIVFNHRLNNYRNYPFFLEAVRDLRKLRQDFTVWCSLADKKDEEYFDIEGVSLKEPYLAKLNKSYLGILCGNRWAISAQDGMAQGLPYLYEDSEENAELFGGLDSPLNMSGKFKTKDDLVSLMNHYLNDLDDRNMFATATLNYSKEVMAWSNRIKSYNDMINKAINSLTSVTEKSEAIKKILTFIDRHGKVTKNEIMKHIGWGVGITFSPYRQYLRNHPTIELEWDGQTEYYCYKDDDGITS